MNEQTLLKAAMITSIIGLFFLYFLTEISPERLISETSAFNEAATREKTGIKLDSEILKIQEDEKKAVLTLRLYDTKQAILFKDHPINISAYLHQRIIAEGSLLDDTFVIDSIQLINS